MVSIFPLLIGYLMHNEVTRLTFSSVELNGYILCSRVTSVMSPLLFCSDTTAYVYVRDRYGVSVNYQTRERLLCGARAQPRTNRCPCTTTIQSWHVATEHVQSRSETARVHAYSQFLSYSSRFQYSVTALINHSHLILLRMVTVNNVWSM